MFRKSSNSTVPDMFSNIYEHLDGRRKKLLDDPNAWHNLFYQHITSKINETTFACLYNKSQGAPNAPIRLLVAMQILKEGFGWSDEVLYSAVEFDLSKMCCLGLNNINDEVPCIATYYNFRKAVYLHQINTGEDLLGDVFESLTRQQAKLFGVTGKFARMDSKLMGSNIAKCSRLQLILSVLDVFYKDITKQGLEGRLSLLDKENLKTWSKKTPGQIIYTMDQQAKEKLLEELGYLLLRLQRDFKEEDSIKYRLIVRILSEQYSITGEKVLLRESKEIKSESLQSPYDEDAAYRKKKEQEVQGYSANITETCNPEGVNLITHPKVEKANVSDTVFLPEAIRASEKIVGAIEHINADGAYNSQENQAFAEENNTQLILSGIQGREGNYELHFKDKEVVEVIDKRTGEIHHPMPHKEDGYKIKENGKFRYFTAAYIASYLLRKQVEEIPQRERNRRNNVEATIFQLSYFTRNNKTRYRGLIKHQYWSYNRCLWINFVRIKKHVTKLGEVCSVVKENQKNREIVTKFNEKLSNSIGGFVNGIIFFTKNTINFFTNSENLIFS